MKSILTYRIDVFINTAPNIITSLIRSLITESCGRTQW